jgi:hypothetical protein
MNKFLDGNESRWAQIVSDVVSPPVVWSLMSIPIAARNSASSQDTWKWAGIYIFIVAMIPTFYIALQVRRGNITDLHMPNREERIRPFVVSTISAALATVLLYQINASSIMKLFAMSSLLQLVIMALITIMWQISIHTFSITGAVITAGALFGWPIAWVLAPLIIIVGMARLRLRRHTRAQVYAGVFVGAISVSGLLVIAGLMEPSIWSRS